MGFSDGAEVTPQTASSYDLDQLAYAVRVAETSNCTLGYGAMYNNCYGIKNGSIAPCSSRGINDMCIYRSQEESTVAFKKIWTEGYGGVFPGKEEASAWTGNDNPDDWLKNVNSAYGQY